MKLVERYLAEVEYRLPANGRDDVIAELRASIEEHIADYSDRSLSNNEQERDYDGDVSVEDQKAILQSYGHPAKVAQSYHSHQYLIGPGLYPSFVQTMRILITVALAIQFLVLLAYALSSDAQVSLITIAIHLLDTAVLITGATVLLFVILERSNDTLSNYEDWQADDLERPAVTLINRSDVLTSLITEGVFLLWWNNAVSFQNWFPLFSEEVQISLSAAWAPWFWPLNILVGAAFVLHAFVLIRGLWGQRTLLVEIVINVLITLIGGALIFKKQLVDTKGLGEWADILSINSSVKGALLVIAGFIAWDIYLAVTRYRKLL